MDLLIRDVCQNILSRQTGGDLMISMLLPVHVGCALISISMFIWRGIAMWIRQPIKHPFLRRTLPDSVDTLFLFTGVMMAFLLGVSPLEADWLAAKLVGLLMYTLLGFVALRSGNIVVKRSGFIAALCVFAYIVAVAHTKSPLPWI